MGGDVPGGPWELALIGEDRAENLPTHVSQLLTVWPVAQTASRHSPRLHESHHHGNIKELNF